MRGLLSVLCCAPAAAYSYSPLFMWSGKNYFTDRNVYVNEAVPSTSLGPLIGRVASQGTQVPAFEEYMSAKADLGSPRVILLALYDQITTEQVTSLAKNGGLHSLQAALDSSSSSLVVPYTYLNATVQGESLATTVRNQFGDVQPASGEQITSASWLKELTKNAATSVVQITMNDATTKDMLSTATNMLDKVTEGQYLVVLSSQQPPLSAPANHGTSSRRRLLSNDNFWPGPSECSHSDEHYDVESGSCFRYVYMTPAILWGLFIGIFGAMVLYTGLGCLDGVQTPDVWMSKDDPGPAKGKEF